MLFRQKEKVPDVGKDNFREFMRREGDSCMNTQLKLSTFVNKTVPNEQKSITPSAFDGSLKMLGNTWDAKHLGTFLQKSQFASIGGRSLKTNEPFQNSVKNQSFFFRSQQPRLIEDNVDYLHQHPINHMISEHPKLNCEEFIQSKMLQVPQKTFEESKIGYTSEPCLKKPKEYLKDLKETKEQQQKYHKWRSEFQDVNRAFKKAKQGFKSGLYALDSPENDNTQLYKIENEELRQKEKKILKNSLQRFKSLERFNASNPAIEFDNVLYVQRKDTLDRGLAPQSLFPQRSYDINEQWMRKKTIEQGINTQSRLFGKTDSVLMNPKRAEYLRQQEMRGRDYNAICLTKSVSD